MIVQKYGGVAMQNYTSRQRVIAHIQKAINDHQKVLVVVSAMGRRGSHYATDTLLELMPNANNRVEADLLSACGELISSSVLSSELNNEGIPTTILYGKKAGIFTNDDYGNAEILQVDTFHLLEGFKDHSCIVVPGFQGISEYTSNFTTLGRGGSDLTAVVYGHHLNAELVEFYKDVPGVMTSDPFINQGAQLIPSMTYNELHKVIIEPVEIIQKRAAIFAALHKVPLHIRSLYKESDGTKIIE